MKSRVWIFAAALSACGLALAQTAPTSAVTETTDPAKIAEIEQHAQQLAAGQSAAPATGEHEPMRKHAARHRKPRAMHTPAMKDKDKAPPETPAAPDSKG